MAEVKKISFSKPDFDSSGRLSFFGSHPDQLNIKDKALQSHYHVLSTVHNSGEEGRNELREIERSITPAQQKSVQDVIGYHYGSDYNTHDIVPSSVDDIQQYLDAHRKVVPEVAEKLEANFKKYAPDQFSRAQAAATELRTIKHQIKTAELKALEAMDIEKIDGTIPLQRRPDGSHFPRNKKAIKAALEKMQAKTRASISELEAATPSLAGAKLAATEISSAVKPAEAEAKPAETAPEVKAEATPVAAVENVVESAAPKATPAAEPIAGAESKPAEPTATTKPAETAAAEVKPAEAAPKEVKSEPKPIESVPSDLKGQTPPPTPTPVKAVGEVTPAAAAAAKEEGFWRGLVNRGKKNLGGEAWKESKIKTGFRAGGAVVGVGMIADATFRSKTTDEAGNEVDRSVGGRVGEGVIGAALAGGSAFIGGGRGK